MSRDCTAPTTITASDLICFHCNQRGYKKSYCLSLSVAGKVVATAPATLRITEGRQGRSEALVVKSRDFQMTAEEAHVTLDVVTGMCLSLTFSLILFVSHDYMFVYRVVLSERHFSYNIV